MIKRKLLWFPYFLVLMVGVVFSIRTLHEPDVWWQLRTGEYILEHGSVPDTDVFSYTYAGEPWINVKWGFEVLMALVSKLGGPEMTVLLQVPATLLIMVFVVGIYRELFSFKGPPPASLLISLLVMLFTISFRLNGRPEMSSHVLTVVYLYLFLSFRSRNDWRIFLLIPLQMLWANLHEGYGVGLVLISIFIVSQWMEHFLFGTREPITKSKGFKLSIAGVLGALAVAIHPSGTIMYSQFLELFNQLDQNRFTTELLSFRSSEYWGFSSYVNIVVALLGVAFMLRRIIKTSFKQTLKDYSPAYLTLLVAFLYLSFNSYRNIPFFMMVATPLLAHFLDNTLGKQSWYPKIVKPGFVGLIAFVAYVMVVSDWFYDNVLTQESYGLGISETQTPLGAATFIEENDLTGKAFADYLSTNYLLWRLQPEYKTYVDLRDLDVFSPTSIENLIHCYTRPNDRISTGETLWEYIKSYDRFEYIELLNAPFFQQMHQTLMHTDKEFDLVYADPLSSVYVRIDDRHQAVLEKYGWKTAGKKEQYHKYTVHESPVIADVINKLFWPLYSLDKEKHRNVDHVRYRNAYYDYIGVSH